LELDFGAFHLQNKHYSKNSIKIRIMNKLLLAFLWIFTLAVAYWYGLTQKMESDRLSVNRSEVTNLEKDTRKVESKEQGSL
jgi:hypothetical protein